MPRKAKPHVHGRDHEHGGADPTLIHWEDDSGDGSGGSGDGVNDADIHVTWTWIGGIFGTGTTLAGTLSDGATPGFWNATSDGTRISCGLEGTWQIDIAGTVTHTGTTAPTIVRLVRNGSSVDIFSVDMAAGDSHTLSYSTSMFLSVGDQVLLEVTHAIGAGTPSSTMTGTMTFTLL